MAKEQTWNITIDGTPHSVTYVHEGLRSSASTLFVDEDEGRLVWPRDGYLDEPITIGNKECRFLLRNYVPDIVVDGKMIDSQKAYRPIADVPIWCRYITAAIILILFFLLRNVWQAIIASGIAWLGTDRISHIPGLSPKKKTWYYLGLLLIILAIALIISIVRSAA